MARFVVLWKTPYHEEMQREEFESYVDARATADNLKDNARAMRMKWAIEPRVESLTPAPGATGSEGGQDG